jgi:hypothetical protein
LAEQIDAAYEAGVIIIGAAGEIGGEVAYPGRFDRVITVSGITPSFRPWDAANRGVAVDICASATRIAAAHPWWCGDALRSEFAIYHGTGLAASFVAAAAVLWLAQIQSGSDQDRDWRRVETFRDAIRASATSPPGWDTRLWGCGWLNLGKLLNVMAPASDRLKPSGSAASQKW